jgi:NitT/TauT family transport system permease protein
MTTVIERRTARQADRRPLKARRHGLPTAARWVLRAVSVAAFLTLWQVLTANQVVFWARFDRLPTLLDVVEAFRTQAASGVYYQDLVGSLRRILLGFGLAALAGVSLGVLISRSPVASDLLRPALEILRPIPAIALVPVAILLFPRTSRGSCSSRSSPPSSLCW